MEDKRKEVLKAKQMKLLKELALITGIDITKKDKNKNKDDKEEKEMEERFEHHLQAFDEVFEINSSERLKQAPLLINLYRNVIQSIYAPSKRYNFSIRKLDKINKDLNKTLTTEQKCLLKQKKYCYDIITDDLIEQSFIFGYSMCSELREESIKNIPLKDIKSKNK